MKIWHEIIQKKNGDKKRADFNKHCTKSGKSQGRRTIALPKEAIEVVEELRKINGQREFALLASALGGNTRIEGDSDNENNSKT